MPAPRPYPLRRSVLGPAGREYGLRVALCVAAATALALALHEEHWYWLPTTTAFLIKPDMGPLFSRVVNRFAGTAVGVLAFTVLAAWCGGTWWPVAVVVAGGALIPAATRHIGLLTAVITMLVLSFMHTVGDTAVTVARLVDTALACGIALLVGHLPRLSDPRVRVGHRFAVALRATERYLRHTLELDRPPRPVRPGPVHLAAAPDPAAAHCAALRHTAYRALAEARAVAEAAAAELPGPYGARRHDWLAVLARAERIADAATVCAVRLEYGVPRPPDAEVHQVTAALAAMADALEDGRGHTAPPLPPGPRGCRSLHDVMTELHAIHTLTTSAPAA
ncbi:FUSC family protein [Streptomyces armeniacus]|uniref:FUSC family protein n=1 Tax=Streptomyces armeniacus TaxID=83291 RepID=A0A345XLL1_9ACTN|nr:FUSC family protein [Streptomyces armeniacus]AXK32527.1 FUSC family protein [Streptomyces armeniacus]